MESTEIRATYGARKRKALGVQQYIPTQLEHRAGAGSGLGGAEYMVWFCSFVSSKKAISQMQGQVSL
jgi:hypothetical protein